MRIIKEYNCGFKDKRLYCNTSNYIFFARLKYDTITEIIQDGHIALKTKIKFFYTMLCTKGKFQFIRMCIELWTKRIIWIIIQKQIDYVLLIFRISFSSIDIPSVAYKDAVYFARLLSISTNSFPVLLVCFQKTEMAKPADCGSELCLLWLVGLSFPASHSPNDIMQLLQWPVYPQKKKK